MKPKHQLKIELKRMSQAQRWQREQEKSYRQWIQRKSRDGSEKRLDNSTEKNLRYKCSKQMDMIKKLNKEFILTITVDQVVG